MARKRDDAGTCLDAALTLAATRGWNNTTLYDIAEESGLTAATVYCARWPHALIRRCLPRSMQIGGRKRARQIVHIADGAFRLSERPA